MKDVEKQKHKYVHLAFSKKMVAISSAFFALTLIFSMYTWYTANRVPTEILAIMVSPLVTIYGGYFVKAGFENTMGSRNNQYTDYSQNQYIDSQNIEPYQDGSNENR